MTTPVFFFADMSPHSSAVFLLWLTRADNKSIPHILMIFNILGCKYFTNSSLELGRTLCFCVLSLSQLFHAFNMKSRTRSLTETGIFNNPKLILSFLACCGLLILVVSVPVLAGIFQVITLNLQQWIIVFALSFFPILFVELQKRLG